MRRRDFVTGVAGSAATWPLSARAQPARDRPRLVGVVAGFTDAEMRPLTQAVREKLRTLGWTEGRDLSIDVRLGAGDYNRMTEEAGQLIGLNPDVIVVLGSPGLAAVRRHSKTVPVVFVFVADPARTGVIESLARPGGYTTGFTNFEFSIGGKWLELLKEVAPRLNRAVLISHPGNPIAGPLAKFIEGAGGPVALDVKTERVHDATDIEAAIVTAAQQPGSGLIIFPDSLTTIHRALIIGLAARHKLPAVYPFRIFPADGGLMSYGLDFAETFRQAATYVDRILRGEKPADLPVQAPNKFDLVINLKTAKSLGLAIPLTLQASADEVIE
jgi:putative ABC transport system substrate-binding protein